MFLSPRVTIDRKNKILCLKLRNRGPIVNTQINKKLAVSYDEHGEIVKLYLLPFSYDEFCPTETGVKKVIPSTPLLGAS